MKRGKDKRKIVLNTTAAPTQTFQTITLNFKGPVRHAQMEGREHLVVPMVMMTEGVLAGSAGALYYPAEELGKVPAIWNHKPVVVYHPEINGEGVSACDPDILTSQKIGVIMNTRFEEGKLKADAWIEKERVEKVDDRILTSLENNQMLELSTGLYTDNELEEGEFKGKKYDSIARNYRPDHLAVLPDKIGACSIEDGAGFLRLNEGQVRNLTKEAKEAYQTFLGLLANEKSHNQVYRDLQALLDMKKGKDVWVDEVFDTFFVYSDMEKLFRLGYAVENEKVVLKGEPEEVVRIVEFRKLDGSFIGNHSQEKEMDKEKMVDKIIANSAWEPTDKEFLMTLEESKLEKMLPKEDEEKTKVPVVPKVEKNASATEDDEKPKVEATKEVTPEEYIENAPAGIRDMLRSGIASHNAEKVALVEVITANEQNTFTEENLLGKDLEELKALALLANGPVKNETTKPAMYMGMADTKQVNNGASGEEVLEMPTLNFGAEK